MKGRPGRKHIVGSGQPSGSINVCTDRVKVDVTDEFKKIELFLAEK